MKKLSQANKGERLKIVKISSSDLSDYLCRKLGILPGDEIEFMNRSILGSPLYFKHQGKNFLALRKAVAEQVVVETIK